MSKSVLVIDTPESCDECTLMTERGSMKFCYAVNSGEYIGENVKEIPGWCPLKEIPNKKEIRDFCICQSDFEQKGYQQGWNTCLDEILKGSENDG